MVAGFAVSAVLVVLAALYAWWRVTVLNGRSEVAFGPGLDG